MRPLAALLFGGLAFAGALGVPVNAARAPERQANPDPAPATYRAVLDKYCVVCHNARLRTGGLVLEGVDVSSIASNGQLWEKVVRKLRTGEMPPLGRPRPDDATSNAWATWLETALDAAAAANPNPGRPPLHRLNRTEYKNAIRDLFDLDVDVDTLLPGDDAAYGFDNVADTLNVSPLLLEQYVDAAEQISSLAVGAAAVPLSAKKYQANTELTQNERLDGMPFGTRGGMLIRHYFRVDGEYTIRIRLTRDQVEYVRGIKETHQIEVALDGERIRLFSVGGLEYNADRPSEIAPDDHLFLRLPVRAGPHDIGVTFLRRSSALIEDPMQPFLRGAVLISSQDNDGGLPWIDYVTITGPYQPAGIGETPSRTRIFVCRPTSPSASASALRATADRSSRQAPMGVADEKRCATRILGRLGRLAYRRPLDSGDLSVLMEFWEQGRAVRGFDAGIEMAIRRLLASPQFVFRFERERGGAGRGPYQISDLELASRLSFFLWSSIPDDELLRVAERGTLRAEGVLARQVRRMLNDPKSDALVSNFAGQWLYLRNLRGVAPNLRVFPDFDDNLRQAFRRETELLFKTIITDDRSVLELLTADYTFVNERLARHYDIRGVLGDHFRRVPVTDPNRRGILGHGSILAVTSYPTRTSPVTRGKWILENLLGSPPPPPPANAPDLKAPDPSGDVRSMRERMEAHRTNPVCASCHARMDPLGLALEHFDAVGQWRTVDIGEGFDPESGAVRPAEGGGTAIDSSGALPNGTKFDGPAGLRAALAGHPDGFVRTMTEKLLVYATGRGLDYHDQPAVRSITRRASAADYRFSELIMGIVTSVPFQSRSGHTQAETTSSAR